jgi:hypothetical protein
MMQFCRVALGINFSVKAIEKLETTENVIN